MGDVMDSLEPVISRLRQIVEALSGLNPDQKIVLWIQSIVGCLTILWIIFQFAWLRRLNEARLERYLEDRIATERDDLAQERQRTIGELDRFTQSRGAVYVLLLTWANIRLAASFILRMLSLGSSRGLASHTQLLAQVGMLHRARSIHTDLAHDAIKRMKLYEGALANKRIEAQNALLAAGRIAAIEGRPSIAVSSFRKAKSLKDDPDARLMIGQQLVGFSDFDGAIAEFRGGLGHSSISERPSTAAELHRGIAKALAAKNALGRARQELGLAQALEEASGDYLGLAKTNEAIGDLFAPRSRNRRAAEAGYLAAIEDFQRAGDARSARRVRRKRRRLIGGPANEDDGFVAQIADAIGRYLLKEVERSRIRAQKRED